MTPPERQLLTLIESAQAKLGEAVELMVVGQPHLAQIHPDAARKLPDLLLRLQAIADGLADKEQRSA